MAVIVFSVPHTGTRFLWKYLEHIDCVYRHYHTDKEAVDELFYEEGSKLIIPMRDPLLNFISHCSRNPKVKPKDILKSVVDHWQILGSQESIFNYVHFRLDAEDQQGEFKKIADFVGKEHKEMQWQVVGLIRNRPSDYSLWKRLQVKWGKVFSDKVLEELKPFRDKYGY